MEIVIKPRRGTPFDFGEVWQYRSLLYFFAWRDFKVRYKQTFLGVAWTLFQPFVSVIVFTVIFGRIMHVRSPNGVPYSIFSYSGLIYWTYFSVAVTRSSESISNNQGIISKTYFPRVIVPVAATVAALVDFLVSLILLAAIAAYLQFKPGWTGVLLIVPLLFMTFLAAAGGGMLFAALGARYRDARQALPFLIQIGFFFTPVIYPVSLIPPRYQWVLYLNPITGVITVARSTLLGQGGLHLAHCAISAVVTLILAIVGYWYFHRKAATFVDVL
jgi:lipopolysaccharide transport system permease protein